MKTDLGYFPWWICQKFSRLKSILQKSFPRLFVLTTNLISCFKTKFSLEKLVTVVSCHGSVHPCIYNFIMGRSELGPLCTFSLPEHSSLCVCWLPGACQARHLAGSCPASLPYSSLEYWAAPQEGQCPLHCAMGSPQPGAGNLSPWG